MPATLTDPEYLLRVVAGDALGRTYPLLAPLTVGRAPECDIHLDEVGISRQHAKLRPLDYGIEVEDLGSTNGSFINGHRVKLGIAAVGDEVAFDQLRFRVDLRRTGAPAPRQSNSDVAVEDSGRKRGGMLSTFLEKLRRTA